METLRRIALTATTFLLFACGICAQQALPEKTGTAAPPVASRGISINARWSAPPAHMELITGAPYCAEEVSDHAQTLADGWDTHYAKDADR